MDLALALILASAAAIVAFWAGKKSAKSRSTGATPTGHRAAGAMKLTASNAREAIQRRPLAITVETDEGSHMAVNELIGLSREEVGKRWTPIKSDQLAGLLSPVVGALPTLGLAQQIGSSTLMEVQVAGALAKAADGNGLRGFVIENGRITEHARLFGTDGLQMATAGVAVWQIASIIVAQKHLADISRQLGTISAKIDEVKQYLERERLAGIESARDFASHVVQAISLEEPSPHDIDTVTKKELELAAFQLQLIKELKDICLSDDNRLVSGTFGSSAEFHDLKDRIRKMKDLSELHELTYRTRMALIFTRAMLLQGEAMIRLRLEDAQKIASDFMKLHSEALGSFRGAASNVNAMMTSSAEITRRKSEVVMLTQLSERCLASLQNDFDSMSLRLEDAIRATREPARALLEVTDGRVSNIYAPAALN